MNRPWQLALAASVVLLGSDGTSHAAEWTPVKEKSDIETTSSNSSPIRWAPVKKESSTASQQPQWQELTDDPDHALPEAVVWTPVEPSVAADIEQKIEEEAPIKDPANTAIAIQPPVMPSGATFANDKAIWRDDTWHPQISSLVPVGFGPKGTMVSLGMYGWDCVPMPAGPCKQPADLNDYFNEVEQRGEAEWEGSIGIGDARHLLGLTVTGMFEETSLPFGSRNEYEIENPRGLFSNYYVGMHLSRSISDDTSIRVGIKNWIDVRDENEAGMRPKSAYGVISQRFRLREKQNTWLPNLYLTAGMGNGEFRPVDKKFKAVIAGQREEGCITYGAPDGKVCSADTFNKVGRRSFSYGELVPIGAIALEVYPGFNLIGEWNEGNLKAGFSVRPFEDAGLVFTSMWGSLLKNCDWGCNVSIPGLPEGAPIDENLTTERVKWSFNLTYNVAF
tara:strand:+ start:813 stop:2156 length:1344 start_codon:yes stop_codon:yes gene_type:complete